MGVWNKFANKVANVGNQGMDKAKGMADQAKTEAEIRALNQNIESNYKILGKMYYEHYSNPESADPDYLSICTAIDQMNTQIAEKQQHIADIKAQITCPGCGKSVPAGSKYCPYCNAPIGAEEIAKANEEAQAAREEAAAQSAVQSAESYTKMQYESTPEPGTRFCTNCGAPLEPGAKFCTKCGTPVDVLPEDQEEPAE